MEGLRTLRACDERHATQINRDPVNDRLRETYSSETAADRDRNQTQAGCRMSYAWFAHQFRQSLKSRLTAAAVVFAAAASQPRGRFLRSAASAAAPGEPAA
jgi:hypothetical protein